MLCEREQQAESRSQFEARVAAEPRISSYQVGEFNTASGDYRVPVDVTYADGGTDTLQVSLAQNSGTGQFEVCGVEE